LFGFLGGSDLPQHEAKKIRPLNSVVPWDGDLPQHEAKTMALLKDDWLGFLGDGDSPQQEAKK